MKERLPKERFEKYIDRSGDCHIWIGCKHSKGYGSFQLGYEHNNKKAYAHRFAYELYIGKIPKGLLILHKCDNPSCVNPAHLFTGTNADNSKDMVSKNRQAKGSKIASSKLKESIVIKIKSMLEKGITHKIIAEKFKVSRDTVTKINTGKTWKHITINI